MTRAGRSASGSLARTLAFCLLSSPVFAADPPTQAVPSPRAGTPAEPSQPPLASAPEQGSFPATESPAQGAESPSVGLSKALPEAPKQGLPATKPAPPPTEEDLFEFLGTIDMDASEISP